MKLISTIALGLILIVFLVNHTQAAAPGDACPIGNECADATTFMECFEATCRCQGDAGKTYYDTADSKCHKIVGEQCEGTTIKTPCPLNGACNTFVIPPVCACNPNDGNFETPTKKCAKALDGECTNNNQCDRDAFISCTGTPKKCNCDPATSKYDAVLKKCALLLNTHCVVGGQPCGKWSECKPTGPGLADTCQCEGNLNDNGKGDCREVYNAACTDDGPQCDETKFLDCIETAPNVKSCQCQIGLADYENSGDCRAVYDGACGGSNPQCAPDEAYHLTCPNDKCVCTEPAEMINQIDDGACHVKATAFCSDELGAQECTKDSKCLLVAGEKRCICDAPSSHNNAGRCVRGYGQGCETTAGSQDCDIDGGQSCHPTEKKCRCDDGKVWNYLDQMCVDPPSPRASNFFNFFPRHP